MKQIDEYIQRLINKMESIGFTRVDIPKDTRPTNRHSYEIHLYYEDMDFISIDCKTKYYYLCFYPFINTSSKNINELPKVFFNTDCLNLHNLEYYKDYDIEAFSIKYHRYFYIISDNIYTNQSKRIREVDVDVISDMFSEFIKMYIEIKNKIQMDKFVKKIENSRTCKYED